MIQNFYYGKKTSIMPENEVNFYDYDGTILYSFSKEAFLGFTQMPQVPTKNIEYNIWNGSWNWSLNEAKIFVEENGYIDIGAFYESPSTPRTGYVLIFQIKLKKVNGKFTLNFDKGQHNNLLIDWGDGSEDEVPYDTPLSQVYHEYAGASNYYYISVYVEGQSEQGDPIVIQGDSSLGCILLQQYSNSRSANYFANHIIEFFSQYCYIKDYAFYKCGSLQYANIYFEDVPQIFNKCSQLRWINLASNQSTIGPLTFDGCSRLVGFTGKNLALKRLAFAYCYLLRKISSNITFVSDTTDEKCFYGCYSLSKIPTIKTDVQNSVFEGCSSLKEVTFGRITGSGLSDAPYTLYANSFKDCTGLEKLNFLPISPPSLSSSNVFSGLPYNCEIYVSNIPTYQLASNYPSPLEYDYYEIEN